MNKLSEDVTEGSRCERIFNCFDLMLRSWMAELSAASVASVNKAQVNIEVIA